MQDTMTKHWAKISAEPMVQKVGEDKVGEVLSSWGPYTSTVGQVYKKNDLALPAVSTKALDSTNRGGLIEVPDKA